MKLIFLLSMTLESAEIVLDSCLHLFTTMVLDLQQEKQADEEKQRKKVKF